MKYSKKEAQSISKSANNNPRINQKQSKLSNTLSNLAQDKIDTIHWYLQIFSEHFLIVEGFYNNISTQILILEAKIAECARKFNAVEWMFSRSVIEIEQSKQMNKSLLQMNEEIQTRLQNLKQQYEAFKRKRLTNSLDLKIQALRDSVQQTQTIRPICCQHIKIANLFEDCIHRLSNILDRSKSQQQMDTNIKNQILLDLIQQMCKQFESNKALSDWFQNKLLQNIRLKFKLATLEVDLRLSSQQSNL